MTDSCDDPCDDVTERQNTLQGWIRPPEKNLEETKETVDPTSMMMYKYDIR
mgnify:CR=1 FL=1|tara:strand:+ start:354 stop:506 length:153 start_codon:yes stop_codon:yes gene_type:complete